MSKKTKSLKHELAARLKAALGAIATKKLVEEVAPELLDKLKPGDDMPAVAELLVDKIVKLAIERDKANQWAVELVWNYIEGRPVPGTAKREDSRLIDERLDQTTAAHLNGIAAAVSRRKDSRGVDAAEGADGPAARLLDMPGNRPRGPEGATGKLAVAAAAQGAGEE